MRICLVYDCLFPHTVGGAERWYRNLGERLAREGHEVTYLTLRQWERGADPGVRGVDVRAVGPQMELYVEGRRRVLPPLVFGVGVLWHLLWHGRRYDAVHTASFPYFSLLAAGLLRPMWRYRLVVDWHEVWTRAYWRGYLGAAGGRIGYAVQRAGVRLRQRAFCFSRLHGQRLVEEGLRGAPTVLRGEYAGSLEGADAVAADDVVVFAGRHIPEKRAPAAVGGIAAARERLPGLRGVVFGDGPERERVLAEIAARGAGDAITAPGFVAAEEVDEALRCALCLLAPSEREGYGLVVVEASARGTPSVVVAGPDNAMVELVEQGVNGFVAPSAEPADLAEAIVRVHEEGLALRERTAAWFREHVHELSLEGSLERVVASYAADSARA